MKTQLMEALLAFVIRMSGGIASYALFATISRTTGPATFGAFSIAFSLAMTGGLVGSFGQQTFFVKEVPKAAAEGRPDIEKGVHVFALVSTLVCASLAALAIGLIGYNKAVFRDQYLLIASSALLTFVYAMSQTAIGGLRIQNRVLYAMASRDLLWRVIAIAGIVASLLYWQTASASSLSAGTVMLIVAASLTPIATVHVYQVLSYASRSYASVRSNIDYRRWTDVGIGLLLVSVISSSDIYLYTIFLGNMLGREEAGAFFASLKTVELLNMFLMAVTLVTAPEISRAIASGDRLRFQRTCNRAILLQGTPAIAAAIFIIIAAPVFMWIFDPAYTSYANLLRLLAFGMLINALTGATVLILQLIDKHWLQVFYQGGSLLLSLVLLPFLLQWLGVYGVAVAFIISKLLWNVLAIRTIRKDRGVDPSLLGLSRGEAGGLRGALEELAMQFRGEKGSIK